MGPAATLCGPCLAELYGARPPSLDLMGLASGLGNLIGQVLRLRHR